MDGPEVELSTTAALLAGDDGADVSAVMQAHVNMVMAVGRRARARGIARGRQYHGPTAGRRGNTRGDFAAGVHNILRNYFDVGGLPPICDERDFETRFRVPRAVFRRVYLAVKDEPFFQQRINATGKLQAHPLQKVVAAFRVIAYGEAADRADEYVRLVKREVSGWMRCFTRDRSEARGQQPLTPLVCPSLNVPEAHPRQRSDRAHKSRRSSRSPRESPRAQLQKELPSRYKYK